MQNLSIEDFSEVVGENGVKIVGNIQQPLSEELEILRHFCKCLMKKKKIKKTRIMETVTDSGG